MARRGSAQPRRRGQVLHGLSPIGRRALPADRRRIQADHEVSSDQRIDGSPTFILDCGRQKLYGTLSTAALSANVGALLGS
jgi:hypothetical protein